MSAKTKAAVQGWLEMHGGDTESLARWMRDSLRVGGIKECRAMIAEAVSA